MKKKHYNPKVDVSSMCARLMVSTVTADFSFGKAFLSENKENALIYFTHKYYS
jgi:hypothetical protein